MTNARIRLKQVVLILSLTLVGSIPSPPNACECFLFLKNELWLPRNLVMSLTNDHLVDCTNFGQATEDCKLYCSNELAVLNSLYSKDPTVLKDYPPSQNLPCNVMPKETVSFSKVCSSQSYVLSSRAYGPPVCCNQSRENPIWCGSFDINPTLPPLAPVDNVIEGRKLDLEKPEDDISQNEIDDTPDTKPETTKTKVKLSTPGAESWTKTILNFFGHNSVGGLIKSIDIFSVPTKVQAAIKTYKDEVSMGQCYMEFTTFKVFTKQENPFEGILRKKREAVDMEGPITRFDGNVNDFDYEDTSSASLDSKSLQMESIKKIAGGITNILESSESTRQYADIISTFLPLLSQMGSGGGGGGGGLPLTSILKFMGPLFSQMGSSSKPSVSNNYNHQPTVQRYPEKTPSSASPGSPLMSMVMQMFGNVVSNFFRPQGNAVNRIETPAPTTTRPTRPSTQAPSQALATSGISTLINLFLQGVTNSPSEARPVVTSTLRPILVTKQTPLQFEQKKGKTFIDLVLELIRPVFISILGTAPGESGVKEIRRVSTLSTLGRVDDNLREEVDSPFFCLKKYMVNKAWSVTENGIRSVIHQFTPEEQARMMRRMLA